MKTGKARCPRIAHDEERIFDRLDRVDIVAENLHAIGHRIHALEKFGRRRHLVHAFENGGDQRTEAGRQTGDAGLPRLVENDFMDRLDRREHDGFDGVRIERALERLTFDGVGHILLQLHEVLRPVHVGDHYVGDEEGQRVVRSEDDV